MKRKLFLCSLLSTALLLPATASAAGISSTAAAEKAALAKVPGASVTESEKDTEDGISVYEVKLVKGNKEYDLVYKASNGKLIEYECENDSVWASSSGKAQTKKQIRAKAKKKVKNAKITAVQTDYDDGKKEYEIHMKKNKKRYTLKYTSTGKLAEYKWKIV